MVLSEPRKKSQVTPPGIDPGTVRLVAQRLNHYATPGPQFVVRTIMIYCCVWCKYIHFYNVAQRDGLRKIETLTDLLEKGMWTSKTS